MENIRTIADLMEYTNCKDVQGIPLLTNFEKAFDTIHWTYSVINDIINPQATFLTQKQLKDTYQIETHLIKYQEIYLLKTLNNKIVTLDKVTRKDFYWHPINLQKHKPNNIKKWCDQFQNFENASEKTWSRIFKLPFNTLRNSKFKQFNIRSCTEWYHVTNGYIISK